jgi:predicted phosphoadenosine phosphosulfate sulfurtransferase
MIINKSNLKPIIHGENLLNIFYKCLRIGWQSGVSFNNDRLISWDSKEEKMWIRPMPKNEDLGVEVVTSDNIKTCNPVPLEILPLDIQKLRINDGSVFEKNGVKVVANYGCGNRPLNWKGYSDVQFSAWVFPGMDEDLEQDTFSDWLLGSFPAGTQMYNLISLRGAESFQRYSILKQSDYSTGEYATHFCNAQK